MRCDIGNFSFRYEFLSSLLCLVQFYDGQMGTVFRKNTVRSFRWSNSDLDFVCWLNRHSIKPSDTAARKKERPDFYLK